MDAQPIQKNSSDSEPDVPDTVHGISGGNEVFANLVGNRIDKLTDIVVSDSPSKHIAQHSPQFFILIHLFLHTQLTHDGYNAVMRRE